MPTFTPNYDFNLPLVNDPTDQDLWGAELNANWSSIDGILNARTQDYNFAGFQIVEPLIKYASEAAFNLGSSLNGAVTIDYSNGNYQYGTLSNNISGLTITNTPSSGTVGFFSLELNQPSGANYTITLDNTVYLTPGDISVTLTPVNAAKDKLRFETRNGGTTWDVFTNLNIK